MVDDNKKFKPGVYGSDYFTSSSMAIYIGDVFIDDITGFSCQVTQQRTPIYGYADTYFRDVSKGQVLVQGQFSINFKEAGYMFLVLERYKTLMEGNSKINPFQNSQEVSRRNIEQIINGEVTTFQRNQAIQALAAADASTPLSTKLKQQQFAERQETARQLGGFSSIVRIDGIGRAENQFEAFEDAIWGRDTATLENENRRADDPDLNPFEIYIGFGDFAGDNRANHTIQKITGVHIINTTKQVSLEGTPIQEHYSFIARNII